MSADSWPPAAPPPTGTERAAMLSMTRRVTFTVLAAFAAVFVVLFAWLWQESLGRETGELDRSTLRSAQGMARALDEADSDEGARALVLIYNHLQAQAEPAEGPPLHVAVMRRDGSSTRIGPALAGLDLAAAPDGISTQTRGPQHWRLYVASGNRWRVALVDDAPARSQWYGLMLSADLALYLGIALPLVLVPVWLMARATLKPLRRLSQTVAARSPLDTDPLPDNGRWKELAPLELALNQLFQRMARSLAREKAFVHDAAHELRTPLAVIATQAHVLATSEGPAREAARERLVAAVARSSHLAQQLLQLARADAASQLQAERLDPMNLVRDAMSLLSERAAAQGTELELQGPDHLAIDADPRVLRFILDNLLDNALRYGGPGGVVQVEVALTHGVLVIAVADQGPGIAAPLREQVFERFWRGPGETQPGSGLGLAIVREAARGLGGDAEVAGVAHGATVRVWLPARH